LDVVLGVFLRELDVLELVQEGNLVHHVLKVCGLLLGGPFKGGIEAGIECLRG
jgi:hypothetical protein